MKILIRVAKALSIAAIAGSTALAQDQLNHEFEVRGIYSIPGGETSFAGSTIDFSRDFDLPNRLNLDLLYTYRSANRKHKFGVAYARSSYTSTTTLTRTIEFLRQTYDINLQITAERKLQDFSASYAYRWGNEKVRIGPEVALGIIKPTVSIATTLNGTPNFREGSIRKFAGLVGYNLEFTPTQQVELFNNLGGIAYKRDRLFRVEGGLKYFPARHFGVSGGYKLVNYKLVDDPNFIRARAHGPFFGGVLRF